MWYWYWGHETGSWAKKNSTATYGLGHKKTCVWGAPIIEKIQINLRICQYELEAIVFCGAVKPHLIKDGSDHTVQMHRMTGKPLLTTCDETGFLATLLLCFLFIEKNGSQSFYPLSGVVLWRLSVTVHILSLCNILSW